MFLFRYLKVNVKNRHWPCIPQRFTRHSNWINAQPNSLSFLNAFKVRSTQLPESACLFQFLFVYSSRVCPGYHVSPSVCDLRKMADGSLGVSLRKNPFRGMPGPRSDVTSTSAADTSRWLDANLLPCAAAAAFWKGNEPEVGFQKKTVKTAGH